MVLPIKYRILRDSQSETGTKLRKLLTDIWDDPEFIAGILRDLKTDYEKQILIDEIESGLTDTDEITLLSWDIKFNKKEDEENNHCKSNRELQIYCRKPEL